MSDEQSLRDKQVSAIERMLNLNQDRGEDGEDRTIWKVLVFDSLGRDIISSVLRVNDLFKNGVTVHMLLGAERTAIPDVPAVYFVAPTEENMRIIARDLNAGLYESFYLNFTSPLPRGLLETLAGETLASSHLISQVYDQYLNFVVTEPNIYSLGLERVFTTLSTPGVSDAQVERLIDDIVDGLFSVVLTSGSIPIIRCSRGNAAEAVAAKLDKKLRNHVVNTRHMQQPQMAQSVRPVLILLDRNIDLVSMFSHSWTYQSLINDTCELNRNRITVTTEDEPGKVVRKSYDLDPHDFFWAKNSNLPFPEVADNLDAALNKYKADARDISTQTGVANLEDVGQLDPSTNAQGLKAAITALPELTARKKVIDMHMNIATTLLKAIGDRGLAEFFEIEENPSKQTKAAILEKINNKEFKEPKDKLRMFLIYYLLTDKMSTADLAEFEGALTAQGCDLSALAYVKRNKEMNKITQASYTTQTTGGSDQSDLFKSFSGITNKLTDRLTDGKLTEGFGNLISGVKNLLPASKDLPVTKIVESIMEPGQSSSTASSQITDEYLYFDPRATRGSASRPPKRQSYDEAIIFTVGGGNYFEYSNLQDWVQRIGGSKKVVYGSTELCSPANFLSECEALGKGL
ncbi:protein Sly1p [Trichomonascus vanleenenianus]|uniref:syntaxin-binding protein n=1 Tax=Trichomonascus vanleenenianus TaxID=2268995 RepID=UPI003ECB7D21